MMTKVSLTFFVGFVVLLGTLVFGVDSVLAKNWNLTKQKDNTIRILKTHLAGLHGH